MGWRILSDPLPAGLLHQVKVKLCSSRISGILGATQSVICYTYIGIGLLYGRSPFILINRSDLPPPPPTLSRLKIFLIVSWRVSLGSGQSTGGRISGNRAPNINVTPCVRHNFFAWAVSRIDNVAARVGQSVVKQLFGFQVFLYIFFWAFVVVLLVQPFSSTGALYVVRCHCRSL